MHFLKFMIHEDCNFPLKYAITAQNKINQCKNYPSNPPEVPQIRTWTVFCYSFPPSICDPWEVSWYVAVYDNVKEGTIFENTQLTLTQVANSKANDSF